MSLFSLLGGGGSKSTGGRLLERIGSATLLEDRREALAQFKQLSTTEALRLVEKGGIGLIASAARDDDPLVAREAVETLVNLMDEAIPKGMPDAARVAAAHNAKQFHSNPANLAAALRCGVQASVA
eukprot:6191007-Pleurochrysis_carterae.AAC.5